ncbi:hypothetical protein FRC10_010329 [Ceratobasidium sp. 414]|nr:hypothetical protein FRC10_010329 [Ceratobasidium sp. 414]
MTQTVSLAHLAPSKPTAAESSSRKTLTALALAVAKAKRIVVVTGAGISCSSGIPDFRSSDGLYNLVKSRYPDAVLKGRDLFDSALFRDPTSSAVFYTFMAELKTQIDSAHPAPVHDFLATLDTKGKLLRSYTQNIDGLEERAGLRTGEVNPAGGGAGGPRPKNVQLHGDIHRVRCTLCSASLVCTSEHIDQFRTGTPPDCPECTARSDARTARSARALKCGTLRPAIVLYDEPHPLGDHIGAVQTSDLGKKPDLLIVMGTSLKVHGLRRLVKSFAKVVHSSRPSPATSTSHSLLHNVVFVNRTPPPLGEWTGVIDYHVEGDADTWVAQVLGEWKKSRPADWEVQSTLDEVNIGRVVKGLGAPGMPGKTKVGSGPEKGKKGKVGVIAKPKGKEKGKSKAGAENTPPEDERSPSQQNRCVVVLPRSSHFKAGAVKSPLRVCATKSPLKTRTTKLKALGLGNGRPCQLGMSSPRRLGGTSLKRPAQSPLERRQTRLDTVFRQSPASRARASGDASPTVGAGSSAPSRVVSSLSFGSTLSSVPAPSSGTPSTDDSLLPSDRNTDLSSVPSSSSSPSLVASALSSQVDLLASESQEPKQDEASAPSSQASTSLSSHDSIFSSQSSQDTNASSQGSFAVSSQTHSDSCSQSSFHQEAKRYLGQPRPPPFRRRFQTVPEFGAGSEWRTGTQRLPSVGPFSQPEAKPRRATTIPIPGRDYVISKGGEKVYGSRDAAEPLSAFASQISLAPPPAPSQSLLPPTKRYVGAIKSPGTVLRPSYWDEGSPRKKGRVSEERDEGEQWQEVEESKEYTTEDEGDVARRLLFSKGKEVGDMSIDADVIDLDPDEDGGNREDSMSLDGAVGHMSLDGPADVDTDMDAEPTPAMARPPLSPLQTRAKKRAKEKKEAAAIKRTTKKAPRPRAVGTRTSSRLAALVA